MEGWMEAWKEEERDKWMEGRAGWAVERGNATGYGKGGKQGEGKGDG